MCRQVRTLLAAVRHLETAIAEVVPEPELRMSLGSQEAEDMTITAVLDGEEGREHDQA